MSTPSNNVSWKPVVLLLLAAAFAYLAIRTSTLTSIVVFRSFIMAKLDLRWLFWLCTGLATVSVLWLIHFVFRELHMRGMLPVPLKVFYEPKFEANVRRIHATLQSRMKTLSGRFLVTGSGILVITMLISNTLLVRDSEVNTYLYEYLSAILPRAETKQSSVTTLQLNLFTAGIDGTQYLRSCLKVVRDLKEVGTKAVLIDLRDVVDWQSQVHLKLIEDMRGTNIVVFGVSGMRISSQMQKVSGVFTLRSYELAYNPLLSRIMPARGGDDSPDVVLSLLRRFRQYPDDLRPAFDQSGVILGDYRIPVSTDGWMLSRDRFGDPGLWARLHVAQFWRNDSAIIIYQDGVQTRLNLQDYRDRFAGKIIVLTRGSQAGFESFFFGRAYAGMIENILQGTITRRIELGPLWLSALCIAVSLLLAHRCKPLIAALLIALFGCCLLVGGSLLYDRANVLIEIVYPLLSLLMTMVLFPALAFVDRLGSYQ